MSTEKTDFKTTSQNEYNILEILNSVNQIDIPSLRQIFLLLLRNFYNSPRSFNADGTVIPDSYYKYTYTDNIVDPNHLQKDTLRIELGFSSAENSIDKTDYLNNNQKPSIYVDVSDVIYDNQPVINNLVGKYGDVSEMAVVGSVNIVFSHYANTYDDAAKLASLTTNYFIAMKDYIKKNLDIVYFLPVINKSPIPGINNYVDDAQKYFMAQSMFKIVFQSNWKIRPESVLIKKFSIVLNSIAGIDKNKIDQTQ